ncbi:MAG TPA: DEAD/DEAH box helicase [Acidimicrobiales bacterium]|nr:DEAD/DEAH box helicase [Acidimicrobiales bacterium]
MSPGESIRRNFEARFEFPLDGFQVEALDAIDADESVLVSAPTGSGKTVIAEYAVARARAEGRRVFYTTPIKALSNQKFTDLERWLGSENVGLLTGDNSIRHEAPVVVMTTEVLRNMIYSGSADLGDLGWVVLDEVHFLQDSYRGPVWEEVIIGAPESVRLVGLSATVSNADELAAWIAEVRGVCRCVVETHRPVDLEQRFLVNDRARRRVVDLATLAGDRPDPRTVGWLKSHGGSGPGGRRRISRPRQTDVVTHLRSRRRLPAIYFIFSRKGCDEAVERCLRAGLDLLEGDERTRVAELAERHTAGLGKADLELLGFGRLLRGLRAGVAAHHAGMVPPFKELVEACFTAGLLKVVFATETLALGINMPARSVVIEQLSRFRGDGHAMLTPGEYSQLTGRAGRRGIDTTGYAYTMWSPYVSFAEISELAASKEFELRSVFRPTYNMAANLISTTTREGALELIESSFAQFQADRTIVSLARRARKLSAELERLTEEFTGRFGRLDLELPGNEPETAQGPEVPVDPEVVRSLGRLRPGDVIVDDEHRGTGYLVVLSVSQRRGRGVRLRAVSQRGKTMQLSERDFSSPVSPVARLDLPGPYRPARRDFQRAAARALRRLDLPRLDRGGPPGERTGGSHRERRALEARIERTSLQLHTVEARLRRAEQGLGRMLDHVLEILSTMGYVVDWELTARGRTLARIFHENDLWVAESLARGVFDDLEPADLAAVASMISYRPRGSAPAVEEWFPNRTVAERFDELDRIAGDLARREAPVGLPPTPRPEAGFVPEAHGWVLGAGLDVVMGESRLSGGEFVRNMRQLIDLLRQVAAAAPEPATRRAARDAIDRLDRGLVSSATRVPERLVDETAGTGETGPPPGGVVRGDPGVGGGGSAEGADR